MIVDSKLSDALARLDRDPDFRLLMDAIASERDKNYVELLRSRDTIFVHQLQGATQVLVDIEQAVKAATTRR